MGIPERLKDARGELALSQAALAEAINVTKRSVINWEGGTGTPTADVLKRYADIGVDVLYVITGQRSQPVSAEAVLPKEERALLDSYRLCSINARKNLLQTAALLAAGLGSAPPARLDMNIQVSAKGNHVVAGRDITIHSPSAKGSGGNNVKGRTPARPRGKT